MSKIKINGDSVQISVAASDLESVIHKAVEEAVVKELKGKILLALRNDAIILAKQYLASEELEVVFKRSLMDIILEMAASSSRTLKKEVRKALTEVFEEEIAKTIKKDKRIKKAILS